MSRLEGNGRWHSKMLLTEHQEQYDQRQDPKRSNRPTPEELVMIRDYVLLPHMMTMVQKGIDDIEKSPNVLASVLRRPSLEAAHALLTRLSQDLYLLRRELTKRKIRIIEDEQIDMTVYYRYFCRGYEDRFGMVREVMRGEISKRMTRYSGQLSKVLHEWSKNTDGDKPAEAGE